jgi:hypothetical protein
MVFLGSSLLAQKFAQHLGERGDEPQRRRQLFKGETKRQLLGIPMLMGKLISPQLPAVLGNGRQRKG